MTRTTSRAVLALALVVCARAGQAQTIVAALPRVLLNTLPTESAPAPGGVVRSVANGGNLQSALNAAQPGDVVELAAGATFTGNFTLPNKNTASTKWITIRPSNYASLPAANTRMLPATAASLTLPKVRTNTVSAAFYVDTAAHHYRIQGIEFLLDSTATSALLVTDLIRIGNSVGNGQTTAAKQPHDIIVERVYMHGNTANDLQRGIQINGRNVAVVDSYITEVHSVGSDAQAIHVFNATCPCKIANNFLEGSTENVMLGGGGDPMPGTVPSDIEVRFNHMYKPTSWRTGSPTWNVKNIFEIKSAQRVLVEANVLENIWTASQNGYAMLLKSSDASGTCIQCTGSDLTIRWNYLTNVVGGFTVAASPDNAFPTVHARRMQIVNNLVTQFNLINPGGGGNVYGALLLGDVQDIAFIHNTMMAPSDQAIAPDVTGYAAASMLRMTIRDNVINGGTFGIKAPGIASGNLSIAATMNSPSINRNVIILSGGGASYPTNNFYPLTAAAVGFVNLAGLNYAIDISSPYWHQGTDNRNPGADVAGVMARTAGVVIP